MDNIIKGCAGLMLGCFCTLLLIPMCFLTYLAFAALWGMVTG